MHSAQQTILMMIAAPRGTGDDHHPETIGVDVGFEECHPVSLRGVLYKLHAFVKSRDQLLRSFPCEQVVGPREPHEADRDLAMLRGPLARKQVLADRGDSTASRSASAPFSRSIVGASWRPGARVSSGNAPSGATHPAGAVRRSPERAGSRPCALQTRSGRSAWQSDRTRSARGARWDHRRGTSRARRCVCRPTSATQSGRLASAHCRPSQERPHAVRRAGRSNRVVIALEQQDDRITGPFHQLRTVVPGRAEGAR